MKKQKPEYPVVAVKAYDWAGYDSEQYDVNSADQFNLMSAWVVGFLLFEDDDKVVLAREHFVCEQHVRTVIVISKSSIEARVDY